MGTFTDENGKLVRKSGNEILWIQPWSFDGLRVRATVNNEMPDLNWALNDIDSPAGKIKIEEDEASITNGNLKAEIDKVGQIKFIRMSDKKTLIEEVNPHLLHPPNRFYKSVGGNLYQTAQRFKSNKEERFYGLGQHRHGYLDQKGCVIDLIQKNTEVSIPWLVSNRMYGMLWNNPGIGRIELAKNHTCWINDGTRLIDYYITVGDSYSDLMSKYADVTGHAPMMPEWAAGFWQSRCRYPDQDAVMKVAREYKKRNLPISVIVIDFFHWSMMGEWKFGSVNFPDPPAMMKELTEMGIKPMVSVWPTLNRNSENYKPMRDQGLLLRTERGTDALMTMPDYPAMVNHHIHYYDASNPNGRKYLWNRLKEGYYDLGIKLFWLDACEPETYPADFDNLRFHLGNGLEVGCIYPVLHQKGIFEGMKSVGEEDVVTLCRSGWAGSQKYGAVIWSGDIESTFESLQEQVRAGLNISMSGIPWWNTDIGGFMYGDINSEYFQELIVRWFQYGLFTPIFRLHGYREPSGHHTGAENEIWSFGDKAYEIITGIINLREKLKPYIMEHMKIAHEKGTPMMRPMFFDFPDDDMCYEIEDQFMFGPDILVAPVLNKGQIERDVYLPEGANWTDVHTGGVIEGGQLGTVDAPLDQVPYFFRDDFKL